MATTPELFQYDRGCRGNGIDLIAGVDEVGRGPLAGPVVAAAVILPGDFFLEGLRDSKKLPAERRMTLAIEIIQQSLAVGIGVVDAETIDQMNILEATRLAMRLALDDLSVRPHMVLLDAMTLPDLALPQRSIIRGDDTSASIAAASVVAKEIRGGLMMELHRVYPDYDFHRHKGYGTRLHLERLRKHGPCAIHRKTFSPVRQQGLPF